MSATRALRETSATAGRDTDHPPCGSGRRYAAGGAGHMTMDPTAGLSRHTGAPRRRLLRYVGRAGPKPALAASAAGAATVALAGTRRPAPHRPDTDSLRLREKRSHNALRPAAFRPY